MAYVSSITSQYTTTTEIRYLDRLDLYKTEKPYEVTFLPVNTRRPDARKSNLSFTSWPVKIRDFSICRGDFNTDRQGFEIDHFPVSLTETELRDIHAVESQYYPAAELYLKEKYTAKRVYIFDTTVRQEATPRPDNNAQLKNQQILAPALDCHVDQSPGSVRRRVQCAFPEEAEKLLNLRVRVINIWRPLGWPSMTSPLAMCDWRSTKPEDYILSDHRTMVWEGESVQVHHNPSHEWWFASELRKDEVLLLKMYDSAADASKADEGIAMCTPHSAFQWKDAPDAVVPRNSMEIRAIVFS